LRRLAGGSDGENGLLVAPGDVGALAEALRRLLADAELRSRLGAAARLTYERRFSADRFVAALADVYGESGFTPGATRDSDVIGVPTPPG
jgi:glycosyltransferase involved in cell wall biosynthesis